MNCPRCGSENVNAVSNVKGSSKGYGCCSGAIGAIILGPIGWLCGLCGSGGKTKTEILFVCNKCGHRFKNSLFNKISGQSKTKSSTNDPSANKTSTDSYYPSLAPSISCSRCGKEIPSGYSGCPNCGSSQATISYEKTMPLNIVKKDNGLNILCPYCKTINCLDIEFDEFKKTSCSKCNKKITKNNAIFE